MIGKYRAGFVGEGDSAKYFKERLLYIFPELTSEEQSVRDAFYKGVRTGLYHVGMTQPNVIIYNGIPGSFGFHEDMGSLALNPDQLVEDISIRFGVFADELLDPSNNELRANFEARFDDDNSWGPQ